MVNVVPRLFQIMSHCTVSKCSMKCGGAVSSAGAGTVFSLQCAESIVQCDFCKTAPLHQIS